MAAFSTILIAALTLMPGDPGSPTQPPLCVFCGEHGVADALLNILLFVPLGVGLMLLFGSAARTAGVAALISLAIEAIQFFLPGRDAGLSDLLTNTLGALAGAGLVHTWRVWLRPVPAGAARLRRSWAALSIAVLAGGSYLLLPALPRSDWYGQWTPRLGHLDVYRGRVTSARLGSVAMPSQRLRDSDAARASLLRGDTLDVTAIAGPRPYMLAPIFSIYDEREREVFLLGARGTDFVVRYRNRGAAVRLDGSELRVRGAFGVTQPGDTLRLQTAWQQREVALRVNEHRTTDGLHTGDGWMLLAYSQHLSPLAARAATLFWIGFWFVPLGYWTRGRLRNLVEAVLVWLAIMAIPLVMPLRHLPLPLILFAPIAAVAGLLACRIGDFVAERRSAAHQLRHRERMHRSILS